MINYYKVFWVNLIETFYFEFFKNVCNFFYEKSEIEI